MCRVFQGFEQRVALTAGEIELAGGGFGDVNGYDTGDFLTVRLHRD
jgi:hypothetical protein